MPLEIKELHIKVAVTSGPPKPPAASGDGDARDAIVAECVEQVMHILRNKTER